MNAKYWEKPDRINMLHLKSPIPVHLNSFLDNPILIPTLDCHLPHILRSNQEVIANKYACDNEWCRIWRKLRHPRHAQNPRDCKRSHIRQADSSHLFRPQGCQTSVRVSEMSTKSSLTCYGGDASSTQFSKVTGTNTSTGRW